MEKLTYKQAFDKITEAYIKGDIQPGDPQFCFCGTLCNNNPRWYGSKLFGHHRDFAGYKGNDFVMMEKALCDIAYVRQWNEPDSAWEEKLFQGMCAALEVLKDIHKNRGENVEDFQFTKRQTINNDY